MEAHRQLPALHYASHSVAMVLSVTGARMTHVSGLGVRDREDDGVFDREVSLWQNDFSNESALFRTSDGGVCRINELRRVGVSAGSSVRLSLYGTLASFEEQSNARVWTTRDAAPAVDLTDLLRCEGFEGEDPTSLRPGIDGAFYAGLSPVHDVARLPAGHRGPRIGQAGRRAPDHPRPRQRRLTRAGAFPRRARRVRRPRWAAGRRRALWPMASATGPGARRTPRPAQAPGSRTR